MQLTRAGTENATEKIKETEADTEYYFDEDGYLKVKKIKADGSGSNTETEQDNAPDVRDVSPEDDPNAVFPETTVASAGQSAEQTQDTSRITSRIKSVLRIFSYGFFLIIITSFLV